ncbi:hypothetical protein QBC47DRAFT_377545 [Echria macrotheca]|uniref:Uncharacterized protein n=1 Tax=Echria macrotheca TaxID=438768 RepID=A0AAJ0BF58_9PEZI|nr:hypothetical protein QBC47DRAFT_377545 [Echria macrotheca]
MVGGSYSGALAAWTYKLAPDAFWAYHASSGPVNAIYDYWSYFLPIYRGMPKNCSADMVAIAEHIDRVIDTGNATEVHRLKDMFGLADVEHDDDFAIGVGTMAALWQGISPATNYSDFFQMCDSIEGARPVVIWGMNATNTTVGPYHNVTKPPNTTVPATGIGLEKALPNFASWFKNEYLPNDCSGYDYSDWNGTFNTACFDSYNASSIVFTDMALNNSVNRQWYWMLCNEPFAYWQVSSPEDQVSLVPRTVGPEYYQRQCGLFFPPEGNATYGSATGKTTDMLNAMTGGWDLDNTTRLLWVNGEFDPWRSASVSSELRPGGPKQSTPQAPLYLLEGGVHCSDLVVKNGEVNAGIKQAQNSMVETMKGWVQEFYQANPVKPGSKTRRWIG